MDELHPRPDYYKIEVKERVDRVMDALLESRGVAEEHGYEETRFLGWRKTTYSTHVPELSLGEALMLVSWSLKLPLVCFFLAGIALRRGALATGDIVEIEHNRLLEELNCYKMENKQLKQLIMEKNAKMKPIYTRLFDMENILSTIRTEKGLLKKPHADPFFSATGDVSNSALEKDNFIATISPMYLRFALYVDKEIAPQCSSEFS